MKRFEYAQPRTEHEAIELISDVGKETAILAGGTDLVGLMKRMVITPDRVVNIREIESYRRIETDADGNVWVGAAVSLDDFAQSEQTDGFPSPKQVIQGISSIQLQSQGTLVGELLRRPTCWYFREGHGLLAGRGQMVIDGDNRYHAILGNRGPAKFVNASRLAPSLISLGAQLRIVSGGAEGERFVELASLYQTPTSAGQAEHTLKPGELVTHVLIPPSKNRLCAAYEVRHGEGPDQPLTSAAVNVDVRLGRVEQASIVMGQVAPVPWIAQYAAQSLVGKPLDENSALNAAAESVAGAIALSHNEYKIQLAQVAVKRALLRAAGLETGGLDGPLLRQPAEPEMQETNIA